MGQLTTAMRRIVMRGFVLLLLSEPFLQKYVNRPELDQSRND